MRADTPKFGYYIGLLFERKGCERFTADISFVTKINHGPKTFEYKTLETIVGTDDLRPVVMNHTNAKEFIFALMMNGYAPILIPEFCFPALNPEDRARMKDNAERKEVTE